MKIAHRIMFALLIGLLFTGCGDKTAGVEGRITDGQGKPIAALSVIFKQVQPTEGYEQFEAKTGADGVFRVTGLMPLSDYMITPLSDKWKTQFKQKITTLDAGQNLTLPKPIVIRFQVMNNGTVVDTKTGLQWLIHSIKDLTVDSVVETVDGLNVAGLDDWRLPSREELLSLQEQKAPAKPGAEAPLIQKTCCAWVLEPDTNIVDWKFYVEDNNELWLSNKETPDNRVVVVRNLSTPKKAAVAKVEAPASEGASLPTQAAQEPAAKAPESPVAVKPVVSEVKQDSSVRRASRKACAEKKALAAKEAAKAPAAPAAETAEKPAPVAKSAAPKAVETAKKDTPKKAEPQPAAVSQVEKTFTVYFDTGRASLSPKELIRLKAFYSSIKNVKGAIVIEGHCDTTKADNPAHNLRLSLDRASAVATNFMQMGLSHKNVSFELRGMGDQRPVASNETADGRNQNRRVEITFIEK